MQQNWNRLRLWEDNVTEFSNAARVWNRDIFSFIHKKNKRLLNKLHGIHRALSDGSNLFLENIQKQLWQEYEVV